MADLIPLYSHSHYRFMSPSRMTSRPNHQRSASSGARSPSPGKSVTKAKSTNALSDLTSRFTRSTSKIEEFPESNLNTLRDPRLASTSDLSETSTSAPHHPDLSNEVAALSVKLIQAINNQTTLDDTLAETRQQLENAQSKITELQTANDKYRKDITDEVLVKKSDVDYEILRLKASLAEERAQRALAERAKKNIEQELETLTAALFEEANKMVSAAKKEREAVEKKNEQLRSQIKDMENLMASQQQQLAELKSVMQGMGSVRDETDALTIASTAPSSPCATQQSLAGTSRLRETPSFSPITPVSMDLSPGPSTSFSNLIKTVCRTDVQAYDDFRDLLNQSMNSKPPSRAASGSYAGLNVMGLASLAGHSIANSPFGSQGSISQSHSPNSSASSPQPPSAHIPLKETRFYKRALTEDIEPTLRLDMAPGISWLTRRSVLSGICEGGLVVEPMPPASLKYAFPCSLCGERRKGTENERTHRFRTSDSETAQRYPLCMLCLEKVRSCCEFTGYLRLILDGHIRISDPEDEKEAWEETIRLRERMFWSRIGGGVIPTFATAASSPEKTSPDQDSLAPPTESNGEAGDRSSMRLRQCSISESVIVKDSKETSDQSDDPFHSDAKRASIGTTIISQVEIEEVRQEITKEDPKDDIQTSEKVDSEIEQIPEADAQPEQDASDEKPTQVAPMPAAVPEIEHEAPQDRPSTPLPKDDAETAPRLTVSIPGAFD